MKAREHIRIIRLIAGKDVVDALRDRVILTILAGVAFMMLSSQVIGWISSLRQETVYYVFDKGKSTILKNVIRSGELGLVETRSRDELSVRIGGAPGPAIGVIIPEDFDAAAGSGAAVKLPVFVSNRATDRQAEVLATQFESDFNAAGSLQVQAVLSGVRIFPEESSSDYPMMLGFGLVMGVMTIGLILTPYLIIEEKTIHTLDVLLVSPASYTHLVAGKLITGMVYSLSGSILVVGFSWRWVAHWEVILPAIFLGSICASAIGLLIGIWFDQPTSVNMAGSLFVAAIIVPLVFWPRLDGVLSTGLQTLVRWLPSIRMYLVVRQSFAGSPAAGEVLANIAALATASLLILLLLVFRINRMGR